MDNGSLFPYRFYRGKGRTRKGKPSIPIGHGVFSVEGISGAGKSTPEAEDGGKLRRNPRQFSPPQAVKKILVAVEVEAPVPQTDSGRLG